MAKCKLCIQTRNSPRTCIVPILLGMGIRVSRESGTNPSLGECMGCTHTAEKRRYRICHKVQMKFKEREKGERDKLTINKTYVVLRWPQKTWRVTHRTAKQLQSAGTWSWVGCTPKRSESWKHDMDEPLRRAERLELHSRADSLVGSHGSTPWRRW